jgi:hypothetical protein
MDKTDLKGTKGLMLSLDPDFRRKRFYYSFKFVTGLIHFLDQRINNT